MKKVLLNIAAGLCLISCSMEEQLPDNSASGNCIKVSFETLAPSTDAPTKTTLDGEQLVWTGDETLDVLIGNSGSSDASTSKAVALNFDPSTTTFNGVIDLGSFTESDIRAITVPGNSGAWISCENDAYHANIPLTLNQVQVKDGVMNGDNFPLYADITDEIRANCKLEDGSFRFRNIQLEWACSAVRFNVYGTHAAMDSNEILKSVSVSMDEEITVSLSESATIAGKNAEDGVKIFMAIRPYGSNINSVTVTTDKAVYELSGKNGALKVLEGEDIRGNMYQFGLNLAKFERTAFPVADLLDISFTANGAKDLSASNMTVEYKSGSTTNNYYDEKFSGYIAHFDNPFNTNSLKTGFYKVDFENNTAYRNKLADGHTLEVMFKADAVASGNYEVKPFSAMEKGGTGFLFTKPDDKGGDIAFLPNVSATGSSNWIWAQSGIVPVPGQYYHVVGIWNQEEGKAYTYVNGVLTATADAVGNLVFASEGRNWWCIGGDSYKADQMHCGFKGDVAIARAYDAPLTAKQIEMLWDKVKAFQSSDSETETIILGGLEMLSNVTVKPGCTFYIYGTGFEKGDIIKLGSTPCKTTLGENCVKVTIPEGLTSGQTEVHITRGNASALLKNVNFTVSTSIYPAKNPEVVAHRGYHPGNVSENSISSLVEAQKLGVFGSEFDVYVTTDNVVVIYHDATLGNGLRIDSSSYNDLKNYKLGNGESLPTFEQHLIQGKKYPDVKLVCEVKPHATLDLSLKCVDACAALVNQYDMADQVAWISFDYNVCKKIAELYPDAKVQYLSDSNPPLDPETVLNDGINGIDYQMKVLSDALIYKAHELGMDVNVWTVNNRSDMFKFIEKGVDYITTNESALALELVSRPYITE